MKHPLIPLLLLLPILVFSCRKKEVIEEAVSSTPPNILLIIADDLGKDAFNGYPEGSQKANTPNLDALRNKGLTFVNSWVYSTCSPTRAAIITGKYGFHTGVKYASDPLSTSETTLHQYIKTSSKYNYATALIGKWHLSGNGSPGFNPETMGIDYFSGILSGSSDYFQWNLSEDGKQSAQTTYITEKFTNLSIDWINAQTQPWFLWLAYTAPHTPFHLPPSEMHSQQNLPEYVQGMDPLPYYLAATEAMDFQIGRLLTQIPAEQLENTIIFFISDNGAPNQVAQLPYLGTRVKGTLYQGGINTPFFVSGKGVNRVGLDSNIVECTDLFATIAGLAGVPVEETENSKNIMRLFTENDAVNAYQYSEMDDGNGDAWAISDGTYKLIVLASGSKLFYHIVSDPYESNNLLSRPLSPAENVAYTRLVAESDKIRQ